MHGEANSILETGPALARTAAMAVQELAPRGPETSGCPPTNNESCVVCFQPGGSLRYETLQGPPTSIHAITTSTIRKPNTRYTRMKIKLNRIEWQICKVGFVH